MKFTQRKLQVASGDPAGPRIDDATILLNVTGAPSACVINFFEARDRLRAGFEVSSKEFQVNWRPAKLLTDYLQLSGSIVSRSQSIGSFRRQLWSILFSG